MQCSTEASETTENCKVGFLWGLYAHRYVHTSMADVCLLRVFCVDTFTYVCIRIQMHRAQSMYICTCYVLCMFTCAYMLHMCVHLHGIHYLWLYEHETSVFCCLRNS